ncbi:MAG: hypothetical protein R2867_44145 [Caldilineaceae bacterium]
MTFNLTATNDANADLEVTGTWTLPIDDTLPPLKTNTILDKNGQVRIDGSTQPGGRSDGPKIVINTNDHSPKSRAKTISSAISRSRKVA